MASELDPEGLSQELIAILRSLGGERAPAELADGVELARLPRVSAPPELWVRVAAELSQDAPRAVPALAQIPAPRTRVLSWPRWAAAAGVLLLAGLAWFGGADPFGPSASSRYEEAGLAQEVPEATRRMLIAKLTVIEVTPEQLSPLGRSFMMSGMVPMRRDG